MNQAHLLMLAVAALAILSCLFASPTRYKFGPSINQTVTRPSVPGELADVEITASIADVRAADPGVTDVDLVFNVPAYDTSTHNLLAEIHAIAFPKGHGVPTDPELAIAATQPKVSVDSSGHTAGGELTVTLESVPPGSTTILTVLGIVDGTAPAPAPSNSPASDQPSATAITTAEPTPATSTAPASPAATPAS